MQGWGLAQPQLEKVGSLVTRLPGNIGISGEIFVLRFPAIFLNKRFPSELKKRNNWGKKE